jgi:hypothetical protein
MAIADSSSPPKQVQRNARITAAAMATRQKS